MSRMTAQEALPKEVANGCCADVKMGDSAPFYMAANRKSTPRWRGPAKISDIDETGV